MLLFIVVATAAHIFRFVRASETETRSGKSISKSATSSQQQRKRLTETERERERLGMRIALTNTHTLHFTSLDSLIQPLTHYLTYCQTTMKNNFVFFKFLSYCFFAVATTYLLLLLRCSLLHTQTLTHTHSRTYAAITRVDGRQKQQQQSHLLMLHSPSPWG